MHSRNDMPEFQLMMATVLVMSVFRVADHKRIHDNHQAEQARQIRQGGPEEGTTVGSMALQLAPFPRRTTGIVVSRIRKSSASDHWSTYSRSIRIHSSKSTVLPPRVCHSPLSPGRMARRRR